jgi:hypothetical protein
LSPNERGDPKLRRAVSQLLNDAQKDARDRDLRREAFLLVGAAYGLERARHYGYKSRDAHEFDDPSKAEVELRAVIAEIAEGRMAAQAPTWDLGNYPQIRRWLAGFYFGSAAERLDAVADTTVRAGRGKSSGLESWFGEYAKWFKHAGRTPMPSKLPEFEDGVAYFLELLTAHRA